MPLTRQLDIWWGNGVPEEKTKGSDFLSGGGLGKLCRDLGWEFWNGSRREVPCPGLCPGLGVAQASSTQRVDPVFLNRYIPGGLCGIFVIPLAPEHPAAGRHFECSAWKLEAVWENRGSLGSKPGSSTC